jgi:hypothetical protein
MCKWVYLLVYTINSLRPSVTELEFKETGPGANRRAEFLVPSLWAKLLEEIRLGHSSAEWKPGIANVKNWVSHIRSTGPGPALPDSWISTVCDEVRKLLLQRTPIEGVYQQSLFGEFFFILHMGLWPKRHIRPLFVFLSFHS